MHSTDQAAAKSARRRWVIFVSNRGFRNHWLNRRRHNEPRTFLKKGYYPNRSLVEWSAHLQTKGTITSMRLIASSYRMCTERR
ncbi:hypothetical protein RUM8411_02690 [Ruegeria meonggei]|uniref:Uncharacterized protein n=1 Tax=Ruegeria meonggei TaxID=1446476 RepID=A0A1X6ZMH3_9RHOB|nr:hypothetical protein RUM8411_02690 [Ruegeria meonggei]